METPKVGRGQYIGHLFILLLLSTVIVVGLSKFSYDVANTYSQNSTDMQALARSNQTIESVNNIKTTIETTLYSNIPLIGGGLTIISGVDAALKTITGFLSEYTSFISEMAVMLGIPSWVSDIAKGVILLLFIFGIISAVVKWRV